MRHRRTWAATAAVLAAAAGLGLGQRGAAPAPAPIEDNSVKHVYKKTPQGELAMQVHLPKGWTAADKRPAIVLFFGGGWTGGKLEQFLPQAAYFAERGMVAARADYRVKSRHDVTPDQCVQDAKSAIRWVRANAAKLGVDPDRIVASGGSAGGHIAACTATSPGLEAEGEDLKVSSRPNLLVLFNPVLNCTDARLVGRYPSPEIAALASPNLHLKKDTPPAIVFFGTDDWLCAHGKEFIANSARAGNEAVLYTAEGQKHGFFNRPPWNERTRYLADEFLARHGYLEGKPTVDLPEGKVAMDKYSLTETSTGQGKQP